MGEKIMEEYIFTFGAGHKYEGYCVRIKGDYDTARAKMIDKFGLNWAFQYSAEEWEDWKTNPKRFWNMEEEIDFDTL